MADDKDAGKPEDRQFADEEKKTGKGFRNRNAQGDDSAPPEEAYPDEIILTEAETLYSPIHEPLPGNEENLETIAAIIDDELQSPVPGEKAAHPPAREDAETVFVPVTDSAEEEDSAEAETVAVQTLSRTVGTGDPGRKTATLEDARTIWAHQVEDGHNPTLTVKPAMDDDSEEEEQKDGKTHTEPDREKEGAKKAKVQVPGVKMRPSHLVIKGKKASVPPDFELLKLIGKGGMGMVFEAKQASIDRDVAIKMIRVGHAKNRSARNKFITEAMVTGDLEHPNIVTVHELSRAQDNSLFYVMKKVDGISWDRLIAEKSLMDNLDILMRVCDAVAYAHDKGVVHRDLKPENVMVGQYGEVVVMDWGLALNFRGRGKGEQVSKASVTAGTPAYMAPETASGKVDSISPKVDIYLLGGILYEIVTGLRPHGGKTVFECLENAMNNQIQTKEPRASREDQGNSGGYDHEEILAVALKAMETKPEDRYGSVKEFQEAIRNYQTHAEAIRLTSQAGNDLEKAIQTKDYNDFAKALFGFTNAKDMWPEYSLAQTGEKEAEYAYAGAAYEKGDYDLAGALLSSDLPEHLALKQEVEKSRRIRDGRKKRLKIATISAAVLAVLVIAILSVAFFWIRSERDRALAAEAATRRENYFHIISLASQRTLDYQVAQAKQLLNTAPKAYQGWEWHRLMQVCSLEMLTLTGHRARVDAVCFSEDGTRIATGSSEKQVHIYDSQTGKMILAVKKLPMPVKKVAFSDDRKTLFIGFANGKGVKYIPGEKRFVPLAEMGEGNTRVVVSQDGRYMIRLGLEKSVEILDAQTKEIVSTLTGHTNYVNAAAFSQDSTKIVTGSLDSTARVFAVETGENILVLQGHLDEVCAVAFSPDGTKVATGSADKTAKLWDAINKRDRMILKGHRGFVTSLSFSPDGKELATVSYDGTIRFWDAGTGKSIRAFETGAGWLYDIDYSPDGKRIITAGFDETATILDPRTGKVLNRLKGHRHKVLSAQFSADGRVAATGSWDGTAALWAADTGHRLFTLSGHNSPVICVSFSPDASFLATGGKDKMVRIWNTKTGKEVRVLKGHTHSVYDLCFSPDGTYLATAAWDKTARIFSVETGETRTILKGHGSALYGIDTSPDGKRIVTVSWDKTMRVWDAETGRELLTISGHTAPVFSVSFSPDGKRVATAGRDKTAVIWKAK